MASMTSTMQVARSAVPARTVSRSCPAAAQPGMFGSRLAIRPAAVQARKAVRVRAADTTEEAQVDIEKYVDDLKEKWDNVENKTAVVIYGAGALTLLWFSSTIVSAVNNVPLLPKLLELVGLGYTVWFTYRYLLFKSSREELLEDIEELKKKISGAVEESDSMSGGELFQGNGSGGTQKRTKGEFSGYGAPEGEDADKIVRGIRASDVGGRQPPAEKAAGQSPVSTGFKQPVGGSADDVCPGNASDPAQELQ